MDDLVAEYLRMGLRIGRLVPGFVDCWFGPPELAAQVAEEAEPTPAALRARVGELLAAEPRDRFLTAQLTALHCTTRRLAGEDVPFAEELESYFEVSIQPTDPERYVAVHQEIAELLPGSGDLAGRIAAHADRDHCPVDRLGDAVRALSQGLRELTRPLVDLPDGESIEYSVVTGKPWNAFNHYLGGFRSHVEINADPGHGLSALPLLVTHESYPGHHTEHCVKEAGLVHGRGELQHTIALVNTPQCLLSEGAGEAAREVVLPEGWGTWAADVLGELGLRLDGELAERLFDLTSRLHPVRQDAALLLHEKGADPEEVVRYLRRWMLVGEGRARHMVGFLSDPLWRAYTTTYVEGVRLVREWLAAAPDRTAAYGRLMREQLLPSQLREELATRR
ncbi:DUF885 domain-containing protein [Umezawaea sp. NPDC059074]|uniref:DUF885 domain-containing protein n=1 Tax=Umezawaea sp. NPDC059074 TaxID=3346716 RepID=UPI0036A8E05A